MVAQTYRNPSHLSALVVDRNPQTRRQVCEVLLQSGYEVNVCDSPEMARESYHFQPLVVTEVAADNGRFAEWLRSQGGGESAPYIMAIQESEGLMLTPMPPEPVWDELLPSPMDEKKFRARLDAIQAWIRNRIVETAQTASEQSAGDFATPAPSPAIWDSPFEVAEPDESWGGEEPLFERALELPIEAPESEPFELDDSGGEPSSFIEEEEKADEAPQEVAPAPAPAEAPRLEQLSAMVESAPVALALLDERLRYAEVNHRWVEDLKLDRAKIMGRHVLDVMPTWRELLIAPFEDAVKGQGAEGEAPLGRADGTEENFRWKIRPWWEERSNRIGGVLMSLERAAAAPEVPAALSEPVPEAEDVSAMPWEGVSMHKAKVEAKADAACADLCGALLRNAPVPAVMLDLGGRIVEANALAIDLVAPEGVTAAGRHFWEVFQPAVAWEQAREEFLGAVKRSLEEKGFRFPAELTSFVETMKAVRQNVRWINLPRLNKDGSLTGVIRLACVGEESSVHGTGFSLHRPGSAAVAPVEAGLEAEPEADGSGPGDVAMGEEAGAMRRLLQGLPFGIILLDVEGDVIYANAAHRELLGVSAEECEDLEAWLREGCPDVAYASRVIDSWRTHVWQKQVTRTFSLKSRDETLKEIEIQPRLLGDGSLLLCLFDVTERKRSEQALGASETKFRALFKNAPGGVALLERSGRFAEVNAAFERLSGYGARELRQLSLEACLHPDDVEALRARVEESMMGNHRGGAGHGETDDALLLRLRQKDGELRPVRAYVRRVENADRVLLYTALFAQDESDLAKAQAQLRASQEQNRAVLEAVPDLMLLTDLDGRVVDLIPAADEGGLEAPETWKGRLLAEVLPGFSPEGDEQLASIRDGARGAAIEFVTREGEGEEKTRLSMRLIRAEGDGLVVHVRKVATPAAPAGAPEAAPAAKTPGDRVFEFLPEAIIVTDLKGRVTACNPAAERVFGRPREGMEGLGLAALYAPEKAAEFNQELSRQLNESGCWKGTVNFVRGDGTEGRAEVLYQPVMEDGKPAMLVGVHREIPEQEAGNVPTETEAEAKADEEEPVSGRQADAVAEEPVTGEGLRKFHHGLRNQLQTLWSLLNLEMDRPGVNGARASLAQHQHRLRAVSLLYEKTRTRESAGGQIPAGDYLEALAEYLRQPGPTGEPDGGPELELSGDEIGLPMRDALALGLIVTELAGLSDRADRQGLGAAPALRLKLDRRGSEAVLRAGMDAEWLKDDRFDSVALQIVKSLVDQLRGTMELGAGERRDFVIRFPLS